MKKYIFSLLCLLAFGMTSCDSFLDIQPVGKVIPKTDDEFRALLAKAYNSIPRDRGMANFRSDEMEVADNQYDLNAYGYLQIWDDNSIKSSDVHFDWKNYYHVIYIANEVIDNGNTIQSKDPAVVNQLIGEAYLLRAYMHFLLVNLHGQPYSVEGAVHAKAIPLIWDTDTEKVRFRNTVGEVFDAVLKDIHTASEYINVEKWEDKFSYRFNTTTVDAMKARVSLYMNNWKDALAAAESVMKADYKLVELTGEKPVLPNHYTSSENINAAEFVMSNPVNYATVLRPEFVALYAEDDLRLNQYFSQPDEETGLRKSIKGGKNEFNCSFRLGEVVLTAAEAAAQLNELDKAKKFLLQLVDKRYTAEGIARVKTDISKLNQKDLLQFIYDERARELALEGHRWFDLRRTTRPEIKKVVEGETYILKQNDTRYTIPIPREAIQANPNLNL